MSETVAEKARGADRSAGRPTGRPGKNFWAHYTTIIVKKVTPSGYNLRTMNSAYAVCLIAVAFHLIAVPALIYAVKTRQGRETDREAYRLVQSAAPRAPRPAAPRPVSRLRMRLFFSLIIAMLVLMCGAQVYLAVVAAHTPASAEDPN